MFNVRAVIIDHYISKSLTELYGNDPNAHKYWLEPVIRIFGSTPKGDKTCVHVHGVYPYIYVPYKGGENPDRDALILGVALDEALKITYNKHKSKFVHKVTVTSGIPLYGYHSSRRQFYKIFFNNPYHVKKASELLMSGAVLGQKLQPHESHIPYVLQFMIDYNIYGMSFVGFSKVRYRRNPDNPESLAGVESCVFSDKIERITYCYLEVDALAIDITNRNAGRGLSANPGLRGIWESEKIRRREKNLPSQFTAEESLSRRPEEPYRAEKMYKDQLFAKLKDVIPQPTSSDQLTVSEITYPAEVPSNLNLLDASALVDVNSEPSGEFDELPDVSFFIAEKVLSQEMMREDEEGGPAAGEGIEAGSILGMDENDGEEKAELENGEDDGGDMTQPLDVEEDVAGGTSAAAAAAAAVDCVSHSDVQDSESQISSCEEFWNNMADRILQIDGAQDSSSDSDSALKTSRANPMPQKQDFTNQAIIKSSSSMSSSASSTTAGFLAILTDTSPSTPLPIIIPQPVATTWSNFAPKVDCSLLPAPSQAPDSWCTWDKNEIIFADFLSPRTQTVSVGDFSVAAKSTSDESNSSLCDLLQSNQLFDNYEGMSSLSPCSNIASTYSDSSPMSVFPSPGRFDNYVDSSINSLPESNSDVYRSSSPTKSPSNSRIDKESTGAGTLGPTDGNNAGIKDVPAELLNNNSSKPSEPSEKTVSMTLKQYLKNVGDVVSVDLKNFNGHEMIVIEYKPSGVTVTGQNKFLMKPLDNFLESWKNAEKKMNEELREKEGDTVCPENSGFDGNDSIRSCLNELKKIKSADRRDNPKGRKETCLERANSPKAKKAKGRKPKNTAMEEKNVQCHSCHSKDGKINEDAYQKEIECKKKLDELVLNDWKSCRSSGQKKDINLASKARKNCDRKCEAENVDVNLINRINTCFEDYFKKVVKENNNNNYNGGSRNNLTRNGNESFAEVVREMESLQKRSRSPAEIEKEEGIRSTGSDEPESVKIVAQLLSAFSRMSQNREMPPLHITINIGNQAAEPTTSQLLQPEYQKTANPLKRERDKSKGKSGKGKKFRFPNVDGTADGSSSEDSVECLSDTRIRMQKKSKRESHYKRLNVILQKSTSKSSPKSEWKRKRSENSDVNVEKTVSGRRDSFDDCSQNQLKTSAISKLRATTSRKKKTGIDSRESSTNSKNDCGKASPKPPSESKVPQFPLSCTLLEKDKGNVEPDIIYDSDDDFKRVKPRKTRKLLTFRRNSRVECLKSEKSVENVKSLKSDVDKNKSVIEKVEAKNIPETQVTSVHEVSCSSLDTTAVFDMSLSELDRTRYRIPPKWSKTNSNLLDQKGASSGETTSASCATLNSEKECSNDSSCMPLSGSPLCSPAQVQEPGSSGQEVKIENIQLWSTSESEFKDELELSNCSSETLTPNASLLCEEFPPTQEYFCTTEDATPSCPTISLNESKVIVPKRKPPTWEKVRLFVAENQDMKEPTQIPHYSDPNDLRKAMESGPLVLKVETTAYSGLKPFKSNLNVLGTNGIRSLFLGTNKKERYQLVVDRVKIITPLKKPPSSSDVIKSLECMQKTDEPNRRKVQTKLIVPLSPGQESHSEEELDVTMSTSTFKDNSIMEPMSSTSKSRRKTLVRGSQEDSSSPGPSLDAFKADTSSIDHCPNQECSTSSKEKFESSGEGTTSSELEKTRVNLFLKENKRCSDNSFQIRGPSLENTFGFDNSVQNLQDAKLGHAYQYMTMLVVEVHVQTRKDFRPDPQHDPIRALFYTVTFDSPNLNEETGIIVVGDVPLSPGFRWVKMVHRVSSEGDLLLKLIDLTRCWDPDILAGYEIEMHSWGYLIQRGFVLGINLFGLLGRIRNEHGEGSNVSFDKDEFDDVPRQIKNMRIPGRIVLDIWRVLRHEVSLTSYTFENVMYHLSQERHPHLSYRDLSFYWEHPTHNYRHITLDYYILRVTGVVRILDRLDFTNRTSELARIFGIQFYEVLSRGSQFRVESMMLRLAKPLNYVPVSPTVGQRAAMRAPASLPLILEPESAFYTDPLIVLDFQSLYPSMIIAYNYCFSTCLGRVEKLGGREPFEFGCTQLQVSPEELKALENDITISPAGVAFVKENIRKGILPTMLEEILNTRLMVKKSMKNNKDNKLLQKVLFAQQLGLKLIANVTYGYTAANFSGRMPSIEVGDSVVSKGRETLHRAIQLVKNNEKWQAKVVYGDTDSIFVLTPGKSRAEAFQIGAEIAEAVTRDNPKPVKLKLEKVYQPSILQTKKRYVGHMYENSEQEKPVFEAKGIETVRRDGCPAVGKILQKALEILFDTKDVSLVKKYAIRQFSKLYQGRVNIQDLIFAKEYRGRNGYRPGACVPALQLARQWTRLDKRAEPRVKERVPYVIVNGPPGVPLIKLVRSPMDLITDPGLHINAFYYITKAIIPPLHRCLCLMGVDVTTWYAEMPKKITKRYNSNLPRVQKKSTISQYFATVECIVCSSITTTPICEDCKNRPQGSVVGLMDKIRRWERCAAAISKICQSCCKHSKEFDCESMDCPVLFRKTQASRDLSQVPSIREIVDSLGCPSTCLPASGSPTKSTSSEIRMEFDNFLCEF